MGSSRTDVREVVGRRISEALQAVVRTVAFTQRNDVGRTVTLSVLHLNRITLAAMLRISWGVGRGQGRSRETSEEVTAKL